VRFILIVGWLDKYGFEVFDLRSVSPVSMLACVHAYLIIQRGPEAIVDVATAAVLNH
jgi:hypothetical protein